jgi:hypothetical protein
MPEMKTVNVVMMAKSEHTNVIKQVCGKRETKLMKVDVSTR